MNILLNFRDLTAGVIAALIAALFSMACSDSPMPQAATAPISESVSGAVNAPRLVPKDRAVPEASRWVGDEHNRLVELAVAELDRARTGNSAAFDRMRHDCGWLVNLMKREAPRTLQRAAFQGSADQAFALAEPAMLRLPDCQSLDDRALGLSPSRAAMMIAATPGSVEEFTPAAFTLIDAALKGIRSARNRAELDNVITSYGAAASKLSTADAAAVHAVLSVAQGSELYWSRHQPKLVRPAQLSLFARNYDAGDWDEFVAVLGADAGACGATLRFFRYFASALPINAKIGLCGLGAAVGSVSYFFAE